MKIFNSIKKALNVVKLEHGDIYYSALLLLLFLICIVVNTIDPLVIIAVIVSVTAVFAIILWFLYLVIEEFIKDIRK